MMSYQLTSASGEAPVAIVVQASVPDIADPQEKAEHDLSFLAKEADAIAGLLHRSGYDVYVARSGFYSEVTELLGKSQICRRLVIFHYCGHANQKSVAMYDDYGGRLAVTAAGLSLQMDAMTNALRLVYMNGCQTEEQERLFAEHFPYVNFIGTRVKIEDWFATEFAIAFYTLLADEGSNAGRTKIGNALRSVTGRYMGYHPDMIHETISLRYEQQDVALARLPDINFRLRDGNGLISSHNNDSMTSRPAHTIMAYCGLVLCLQGLFLWCSHLWSATSSPAFQAAFVYVPSCDNLSDMVRSASLFVRDADAKSASQTMLAALGLPALSCDGPSNFTFGEQGSRFGFWVEWVRSLVMCAVLVFLWCVIYRRIPGEYPKIDLTELKRIPAQIKRWRHLEWNAGFLLLSLVTALMVVGYHTILAHRSLATTDLEGILDSETWMQARWGFYLDEPNIWEAYKSAAVFSPLFDQTGHPNAEAIAKLQTGSKEYFALYMRPYLYYMGYSLLNYLAIAVPILVLFYNGLRFAQRDLTARLQGIVIDLRMARDGISGVTVDYVRRRFRALREDMTRTLDGYALLILSITLFLAYEVLLGRTTTALFAVIMMCLAFLFVVIGSTKIVSVWNSYRDELQQMCRTIDLVRDDDVAQALAPFRVEINQAVLPFRRSALAVLIVLLCIIMALSTLLLNKHWTIFTHL